MNANAGAGKVTRRMVPLQHNKDLARPQMTACRHGNGRDWWLLKQALDTALVYKYLFTPDSVYGPYVQAWADPHFSNFDYGGQSAFSQDGRRYATTARGAGFAWVADFDRCSGMLSNPQVHHLPTMSCHDPNNPAATERFSEGLAFSPSGRFLYLSMYYNVLQLDLQDGSWIPIAGLDTSWAAFQMYSSIYPGPDGRLYVGNFSGFSGQMSRINKPDEKGTGSEFCAKCLRFPLAPTNGSGPMYYGVTSPPNMPNYALGRLNPDCDGNYEAADFRLYPNPSSGSITIEYPVPGRLRLYNATGQLVKDFQLPTGSARTVLELGMLPLGIYAWYYHGDYNHHGSGTLMVK